MYTEEQLFHGKRVTKLTKKTMLRPETVEDGYRRHDKEMDARMRNPFKYTKEVFVMWRRMVKEVCTLFGYEMFISGPRYRGGKWLAAPLGAPKKEIEAPERVKEEEKHVAQEEIPFDVAAFAELTEEGKQHWLRQMCLEHQIKLD